MTTMDIMELAKRRSEAAERINNMSMMSVPAKYEDRVAADARYKIAWDAFMAADRAYHQAIAKMSPDELLELSTKTTPA